MIINEQIALDTQCPYCKKWFNSIFDYRTECTWTGFLKCLFCKKEFEVELDIKLKTKRIK